MSNDETTKFEEYQLATGMAPYDSDSSFEDEDFTETSVLLGYASKEATGDAISQLGGYPVSLTKS